MKQVYEISNVQMVVTYKNYVLTDDGQRENRTEQTITHEGLLSKEQLLTDARSKIAPGEVFDVVIADGVEK